MTLKDKIIYKPPKLFLLEGILSIPVTESFKTVNTLKGGKYNSFCSKVEHFLDVLAEAQRDWRQKALVGLHDIDILKGKTKTKLLKYWDQHLGDAGKFPGGYVFQRHLHELDGQLPHLYADIDQS